jgi:hypothetical protein
MFITFLALTYIFYIYSQRFIFQLKTSEPYKLSFTILLAYIYIIPFSLLFFYAYGMSGFGGGGGINEAWYLLFCYLILIPSVYYFHRLNLKLYRIGVLVISLFPAIIFTILALKVGGNRWMIILSIFTIIQLALYYYRRNGKTELDLLKEARNYLTEPITKELFIQQQNITPQDLNNLISKGKIKAYQTNGVLFIDLATYK